MLVTQTLKLAWGTSTVTHNHGLKNQQNSTTLLTHQLNQEYLAQTTG